MGRIVLLARIDLVWYLLICNRSILLNIRLFVEISRCSRIVNSWVEYLAGVVLRVWTVCSVWTSFHWSLFADRASCFDHFRLLLLHGGNGKVLWRLLLRLEHLVLESGRVVALGLRLELLLLRGCWVCLRWLHGLVWLAHHRDVLVRVLGRCLLSHDHWLVLSVRDSGPGKAELSLPAISAICHRAPATYWWKAVLTQELWRCQRTLQAGEGPFLAAAVHLGHRWGLLMWIVSRGWIATL